MCSTTLVQRWQSSSKEIATVPTDVKSLSAQLCITQQREQKNAAVLAAHGIDMSSW